MQVPSQRFGPYQLLAELGRGGMARVFRARRLDSDREVALKVLGGDVNPKRLERFRREGELTASLNHPGIVRIHDAGAEQGRPYLCYELVEGRTLEATLPDLDRQARLRVLTEVAQAMAFAHRAGIVHRDLKPENVLIDREGRARVSDFGLAWISSQERLTRTNRLVGTPHYMAPEQFGGEVAPSCDVWSLGVLLYRALTDELPFRGDTMVELAAAIQKGNPRPPRAVDKTISQPLEAVCLTALRNAPEERYPSAVELAEDLEAATAGRAISASSSGVGVREALRRRRGPILIGLTLLVPLSLFAATLVAGDPSAATPPPTPPGSPQADPDRSTRVRELLDAGKAEQALVLIEADPRTRLLRCEALLALGRRDEVTRLLPDMPAREQAVVSADVERAQGLDPVPSLREARGRWPEDGAVLEALARHLILDRELRQAQDALEAGASVSGSLRLDSLRSLIATVQQGKVPAQPHPLSVALADALVELANEQIAFGWRYPNSRLPRPERFDRAKRWLSQAYALVEREGRVAGRALAGLCALHRLRDKRADAETLSKLERLAPEDPHVAAELGFHWGPTKPNAALAALDRATHLTSEGQLARAIALSHAGRGKRAIKGVLETGHRDDRRRLHLVATIGAALQISKLRRRAVRSLRWLEEPDPDVNQRAQALRGKRRPQDAMQQIRKLRRDYPLAIEVRYAYGIGLIDAGEDERGFVEVLSLIHDQPLLWGSHGVFHLREVARFEEGGLTDSPIRMVLSSVLDRPGADPYLRGFLCAAMVEFSPAEQDPRWIEVGLKDLTHVLRLEPTALFARMLRALLWIRSSRWERAASDLERIADVSAEHSGMWFYRGLLRAAQNEAVGSVRAAFARASNLGYDLPLREQARQLYPELRPYFERSAFKGTPYWDPKQKLR